MCDWFLSESSDYDERIEVEAEGNIFLSSDLLLPHTSFPHYKMYDYAYRYWTPDEKVLQVIESREYLLEGQAKLVRRIR